MKESTLLICEHCKENVFYIYHGWDSLHCPKCNRLLSPTNAIIRSESLGDGKVVNVALYEVDFGDDVPDTTATPPQ